MARNARKVASTKGRKNGEGGEAADRDGPEGNKFKVDRKEAKSFFDRLDTIHSEMETNRSTFLEDIKSLYKDAAKGLGIPVKAVKEVYADHKYERKKQERRQNMDGDVLDSVDKLTLALGSYVSTPLGKAAIERRELADAAKETATA